MLNLRAYVKRGASRLTGPHGTPLTAVSALLWMYVPASPYGTASQLGPLYFL